MNVVVPESANQSQMRSNLPIILDEVRLVVLENPKEVSWKTPGALVRNPKEIISKGITRVCPVETKVASAPRTIEVLTSIPARVEACFDSVLSFYPSDDF